MKKSGVAVLLIAGMLLSGCNVVDDRLGQIFLERSGVTQQDDYLRYEQYQQEGKLDEEGCYVAPMEQQPERQGQVHVTFANNHYMEVLYYRDAAMATPLASTECYLDPGDTLYAKVERYKDLNSNLYHLAGFRIREYDQQGKVRSEWTEEVTDDRLEYQIPADFTGTELSLLPVGEYADRELSVGVYYLDDQGQEHPLGNAGTWSVNGVPVEGDTVKVSPTESYTLKFKYDDKNYFYVGSEPSCFTKEPENAGFVEFWQAQATEANTDYRVELHPYLTLSLKCSEEAQIRIGEAEAETIKKNVVWNAEKLRYGDTITIETAGECTITDGNYQHIRATKDPITNGYRYMLTVEPESNGTDQLILTVNVDRVFDVVLGTDCDHGTCTYKLDGETLSGTVQLQEGQELTLTYQITQDNYRFAEKSQGIGGFFHDLVKENERTVTIPITADLDGTVIDPDDWFQIEEKEG